MRIALCSVPSLPAYLSRSPSEPLFISSLCKAILVRTSEWVLTVEGLRTLIIHPSKVFLDFKKSPSFTLMTEQASRLFSIVDVGSFVMEIINGKDSQKECYAYDKKDVLTTNLPSRFIIQPETKMERLIHRYWTLNQKYLEVVFLAVKNGVDLLSAEGISDTCKKISRSYTYLTWTPRIALFLEASTLMQESYYLYKKITITDDTHISKIAKREYFLSVMKVVISILKISLIHFPSSLLLSGMLVVNKIVFHYWKKLACEPLRPCEYKKA